jgi:NitT/TauT family transport system substrate-binding protein
MVRIKPAGIVALAVAVLGAGYGGYALYKKVGPGPSRPLVVGVVTWPGYAGGIVANNGFKPNKDCIYYKNYGLEMEFKLMEDVDARAKAFANGSVDIVWSTVDFWANELPGFLKNGLKAKAVMQVDWSQGGDAIVADNSIQTVEQLLGKKISLTLQTPSQWLLEYNISHSKLTPSEQTQIVRGLVGKNASPDARDDFVANRVDAAVVWEPDVTSAVLKRHGSHVLLSSKTANKLIADLMVAREDFIAQHPDMVEKFVRGWFDGTVEANRNPDLVARLLMENEPVYQSLGAEETRKQLPTVKWATLQDNTEMFGLDGKKPLFDGIFGDAGQAWVNRGIIQAAVSPNVAKDTQFLQKIWQSTPVQREQERIPAPPDNLCDLDAIVTNRVTITFDSGKSELNAAAQQVVSKDVSPMMEKMANAYFCLEGNTDSVGSRKSNVELSDKRAAALRQELIDKFGVPPNQVKATGRGPDNPVCEEKTEACYARNRRTDMKVIPTESVKK